MSVRDETLPLAGVAEPTRRDRQTARGLAERQETIGADLKQMLTQTKELQEAKVFDFAHVRMDTLSRSSAGALMEARIGESLSSQAALITTLKNVIEALNDPKPDEKKFAEGAGGGQGGGGQPGQDALLPPVKELMLLRQMQTDLAQRTIETSRLDSPPEQAIRELGAAQRELMNVGQEFVERIKQQGSPSRPGAGGVRPPTPDPVEPEGQKEKVPDAP
ncbi:MAG: hypothetical protein JNK58_04595 [Phycisphaerae bacterium]|nr:hypothetical protein [Phycisphaerae bacterium]